MKKIFVFISLLFLSVSVFAEKKETLIDAFQSNQTYVSFYRIDEDDGHAYNVIVNKSFNEKYSEIVIFSVDKKDGNSLYAEACKNSESPYLYEIMQKEGNENYNLSDSYSEVQDGISYKTLIYIP